MPPARRINSHPKSRIRRRHRFPGFHFPNPNSSAPFARTPRQKEKIRSCPHTPSPPPQSRKAPPMSHRRTLSGKASALPPHSEAPPSPEGISSRRVRRRGNIYVHQHMVRGISRVSETTFVYLHVLVRLPQGNDQLLYRLPAALELRRQDHL